MSGRNSKRLRFAEVGIATLVFAGCLRQATPPVPPESPITRTAQAAVVEYAHRLADSFDKTAGQLRTETLKTAVESNSQLQSSNAEARKQAFQPLDQLLNEELGGDNWDAKKAEQLFQQIARGLRSFP